MNSNDLMEADCWAHMVNVRAIDKESLRARFESFSNRTNLMLLKDWENVNDDEMKKVVTILKEVMKNQSRNS